MATGNPDEVLNVSGQSMDDESRDGVDEEDSAAAAAAAAASISVASAEDAGSTNGEDIAAQQQLLRHNSESSQDALDVLLAKRQSSTPTAANSPVVQPVTPFKCELCSFQVRNCLCNLFDNKVFPSNINRLCADRQQRDLREPRCPARQQD